jgi:hypothetical protein
MALLLTPDADVTLMKANSADRAYDFTVKDAGGKPIFDAQCATVRSGFGGVKRADLEVGTSSEGKARIEGLPDKAKPMTYDITKDDKNA